MASSSDSRFRTDGDPQPPEASSRGGRSVQRILDAAARLFGREGYRGATMHQVARAAGVSKGLLHYHFQSKEHLLIEAQRATFRQIFRRIDERVQGGERGMPTAVAALDGIWEAVREMRAWAPFMVETMSLGSQDGPIRERLDGFYAEAEQLLVDGIHNVFGDDVARLSMSPEQIAHLVRITLHGLIVELAYARTDADVERVQASYLDMRRVFEEIALRPT